MPSPGLLPDAAANRLLASLPAEEFSRLLNDLERFPLALHATLFEPGSRHTHVYFPLSGVVSVLTSMENGDAVEFATVGFEGVAGFPAAFGSFPSATRGMVQVPGESVRMRADDFRSHLAHLPHFQAAVLAYADVMFANAAQSAACNRLHPLNERCARWLLTVHDRVEGDEFPITQ